MKKGNKDQESVMVRLATFVVDKRNLFFLLVIIGTIFTLFSRNWVEVENDLSSYLPIRGSDGGQHFSGGGPSGEGGAPGAGRRAERGIR